MTSQLAFHDHKIKAVSHNKQLHLTATQIGLALNYANPETAVTKIFNRHKDEFTACMVASVKLVDPNGIKQDTRIFSLRGAHLIAMFARTPVAKEFRRWVLDILDRETGEAVTQPNVTTSKINVDILIAVRDDKTAYTKSYAPGQLITVEEALSLLRSRGWLVMPREELAGRLLDL